MHSVSNKLKEHVIKLGTDYLPGSGSGSVIFFHKVPIPVILKNMTSKTAPDNNTLK